MQATSIGRNQACPCGSGRKFKHCCAVKQPLSAAGTPPTSEIDVLLASATTLHRLERLPEAFSAYQQVLQRQPQNALALHMLGMVAQQQGEHLAAIDWISRAIAIEPTPEMHYNLAVAHQATKDWKSAALHYNAAVEMKPDYGMAWTNLASVFKELGYEKASIEAYYRARDLQPALVSAHTNLGLALKQANRQREAVDAFRNAVQLKAEDAASLYGLGSALLGMGNTQNPEGLEYIKAALNSDPTFITAHDNLIFAMDMDPCYGTPELLAERRRWDALHAQPLKAKQLPHANIPSSHRRLRVGYVSGDFKNHSASKVFGAMLRAYDKMNFEVYAYSQLDPLLKDEQTYWFAEGVDHWRDISSLSDDEFAGEIRTDQIDILVDLSGFTAGNRLPVFAQKPAPIQVTAWGYAHSTGMEAMDVFFADVESVPPHDAQIYVEAVRYLPCIVCYHSMGTFPGIGALPAQASGSITFGSFNRLVKVTSLVWDTWIDVLHAVPGSRLLIKAGEIDRPEDRNDLIARFDRRGIAQERLVLVGNSEWQAHLETFSQVDICLDPFPHGGGVSSMEALRMGVPVVSLRGSTTAGRLSTSILTALDMTDWIATTPADYVRLAAEKAADVQGLAQLRVGLRERFDKSSIGDTKAYVAAVEMQYRELWQSWCLQQAQQAPSPALQKGLLLA